MVRAQERATLPAASHLVRLDGRKIYHTAGEEATGRGEAALDISPLLLQSGRERISSWRRPPDRLRERKGRRAFEGEAMSEERKMDRKTFLKEGPLTLLRAFFEGARGEETQIIRSSMEGPLLRPPGAVPESSFLEICIGGGECARACPAYAILLIPREDDPTRVAPVIRPADGACVLCEDLSCMKACPSGALTLVPREAIRIGIARVDPEECWSWSGQDDECRDCVDKCPIGAGAIWIAKEEGGRGPAVGDACTGCGLCEYHCPVYPGAIRVELREGAA
ncbi:MAG: 4Fe-4S dicluster domain-containing protein [bacterium]